MSVGDLVNAAGCCLGTSRWIVVDQQRIDRFAETTGDQQWIHVDVDRAAHGPFGGTIAHGYLTLSLLSAIVDELLDVEGVAAAINYGFDRVRFTAPVWSGSRIRGTAILADAVAADDHVQVALDVNVHDDRGERLVCVARPIYRLYTAAG